MARFRWTGGKVETVIGLDSLPTVRRAIAAGLWLGRAVGVTIWFYLSE
jgi:hypothetical protein